MQVQFSVTFRVLSCLRALGGTPLVSDVHSSPSSFFTVFCCVGVVGLQFGGCRKTFFGEKGENEELTFRSFEY